MWLRRWLKETPVLEEMQRRAALSLVLPLRAALKSHRPAIVASIVSTWMLTAAIVVVILITPLFAPQLFGLAPIQLQAENLAASAALRASTPVVGAAADRFGIRRVALAILLLLIVSTYGLYLGAKAMPVSKLE
jgi:hypothetical protein